MSSILGISGSSYTNYGSYGKLASGKKLQTAADGAAELAIAEKLNSQVKGYDAGTRNMQSGKDLLNIADGALSGVTDYLQRIRELALQASNSALLSDDDLQGIQQEIDYMKQGINDIASQTQYNRQNILDGSKSSFQMATNGNGGSTTLNTANSLLSELGIADFDVTGDFDLGDIDNALMKVSDSRSSMGAQSNALDHAINYNSYTSFNMVGAQSRFEDLDYPKAISEQKKQETLQLYSIMMLKKRQEDEASRMRRFFIS
ncbi:MAG: flagellin FliC5 [Lachnospiraceae bacterium]|nr:flagellin FliC5 [Lachnospiraceae bacterium]